MSKLSILISIFTLFSLYSVHAAEHGQSLDYRVGDKDFKGYVAMAKGDAKATILIVHDWNGLNDYEIERANTLAKMGYNSIAVDLFGVKAKLDNMDDYKRETGALYSDREEFRARLSAAQQAAGEIIGDGKSVLIGYCFGGSAVLEAMRAGQNYDGYASFHGGIKTPEGQSYGDIKKPLLILQGSADPVAKPDVIASVFSELTEAQIPFNAEIYGGVRHAFSVPGARDYDENAAHKSWAAFMEFLENDI